MIWVLCENESWHLVDVGVPTLLGCGCDVDQVVLNGCSLAGGCRI